MIVIIEITWKNNIIQMNKRTNNHYIKDKIEVYNKMVTNESGYENHTTNSNLSNERIVKLIKEISEEIKRRINIIYTYRLKTSKQGIENINLKDLEKSTSI